MARADRSDAHLSLEEDAKRMEESRHYFDEIAPKRHSKPQRSDYSSHYTDSLDDSSSVIPEFSKFQDLENTDSQKLTYMGNEATEEYVETEYYKDLNCIDKQHHTTGTGFIKTENAKGNCFCLTPDHNVSACNASWKGNPATNDWIPAADTVIPNSNKPKRSEN